MAMTKAIANTTPHSITYVLTEAGTAAAELAVNVIADCAAGPLKTLLSTAVADAAAAQALIEDNVDVMLHRRSVSAGDSADLSIDFDDAATVFEMNLLTRKGGDTDEAVFVLTLKYRHSLVA